MRGLFVTGTDTGVGKTVAAAALMLRFRGAADRRVPRAAAASLESQRKGGPGQSRLRYWKPIQTGIEQDDDTATVRRFGACREAEIFDEGVRLPRPLSPHLAARLSGVEIDPAAVVGCLGSQRPTQRWIVEGAGGVLVPVNDSQLMVDLMKLVDLPVLVVARTALGTINHTLLTIEALHSRSLSIAGVLLNGEPNADNRRAIETYGGIPVVGELPRFDPLTPEALARSVESTIDPDQQLVELFS